MIVILTMLASGCSSLAPQPTPEPTATPVPTPTQVPTLSPEEEAAELAKIEAELEEQKHLEKVERAKDLKIVFLIPGTLENPMYNSAYMGLKKVEEEFGSTISYVEMGNKPRGWEAPFLSALDEDWDFIITLDDFVYDKNSNVMTNLVSEHAPSHPEKTFVHLWGFYGSIPSNVVKTNYNMNEATFLAGACAALVTTSGMELANEQPLIGFVGGMSFYPIKNMMMLGYIEGAKYVNNDIKIAISYTEDFNNKGLGEKQAVKQYATGVDVIFQAAGQTGYGVIDAAQAADRYVIGVDTDQAKELEADYPEKAAHILTSTLRMYDGVIFWVIDQYAAGTLEPGIEYTLGIAENAVGIVKNSYYDQLDSNIKTELAEIEEKIKSKEIDLSNLAGMDDGSIDDLVRSVEP